VIELREVAWAHPDGVALRAEQRAELDVRYGTPDSEPGPAPSADDMSAFYVAYRDGVPAGCGGLRELDASHAEVKRMFVRPAARGTGVSSAILARLEQEGRGRGYDRLVLETGDRQPDAMRFYEREGYERIANFGYYANEPHSICYEKRFTR
jgi:GNAT superfamily N-acetyltransferase